MLLLTAAEQSIVAEQLSEIVPGSSTDTPLNKDIFRMYFTAAQKTFTAELITEF